MLSTSSIKPQQPLPSSSSPPVSSVKQALSDFESILDVDELQRFHSAAKIPRATDVLDFVGQIDSNNRSRGGRCVAQRLLKFLESVQQFTGVVNTFVSADPMPAALIWGSVRLTLLTASNIATFFEKTTNMIMIIGRSCPIYEQFGSLYPGHIDLQRALCDYYATIIRICIRTIEVSKRTNLAQTISSVFAPFESQFKDLLDELEQTTKIFRLHLTLASNQTMQDMRQSQVNEMKQNQSRFRATQKYRDDVRREHEDARQWRLQQGIKDANHMRITIKQRLCTFDYQKPWKQATRQLVPGTASWILHTTAFTNWQHDQNSSMLWCTGKMGSGKTMIMSHIVSHLYGHRQANERIAFHFCRSDEETSLTARSIVGSLTSQMLSTQIENLKEDRLLNLYNASGAFGLSDLTNLLIDHFERDATYYVVLDGLDECEEKQISILCDCLGTLVKRSTVCLKFVCASRPELEKQLSQFSMPQHKLSLAKGEVDKDIETAITALITSKLDQGLLQLGDPLLVLQITNVLLERADGIFLWVILVLEEICSKNSDIDILNALQNLPRGMSQLLKQKTAHMSRLEGEAPSVKLLEFCGVAKRPLTLEEYREVLSIAPGQTSLDSSRFVNNMIKLVADCKGLLFYDEEDLTVHYVHTCIKTFLFTNEASPLEHPNIYNADNFLGYLCMTYLNFSNFEQQLAKSSKTTCTISDPIDLALSSVTRHNSLTQKIVQKLLHHRKQVQHLPTVDMNKTLASILTEKEMSQLDEAKNQHYSFRTYARSFWIHHLKTLADAPAEDLQWGLFVKTLSSPRISADKPWVDAGAASMQKFVDVDNEVVSTMFVWAIEHDHAALLWHAKTLTDEIMTYQYLPTILRLTAREENDLILTRLLTIDEWPTSALENALVCAAGRGHDRQVQQLLDAGARIDASARIDDSVDGYGFLYSARTRDILDCLDKKLIQSEQSAGYTDYKTLVHQVRGYDALQAATLFKHSSTVDLLLRAGAMIWSIDRYGQHFAMSSLILASRHIDTTVLDKLIERAGDVNVVCQESTTALLSAALCGNVNAVVALLAAGAKPDYSVDRVTQTPLQAATNGVHAEIVKFLLEAGADPNLCGRLVSYSPLQNAVAKGARGIVLRLLAAGADPSRSHRKLNSPLVLSIIHDRLEIMNDLIRAGGLVNGENSMDKRPLATAISYKRLQAIKDLIDIGAVVFREDERDLFEMFGVSWSESISLRATVRKRVL